jgi:formate-dependent nitrite reductase membrane component NrfD
MFFLWLDLEHPFNAYRFYMVLRPSSPMSWGAWILLLIYPVSILTAWVTTPGDVRERWSRRMSALPRLEAIGDWTLKNTRLLATLNIVAGAALGIYTGVLLGTMAARPLWNSAILGPLFLASGLSTGAAFMLLYRLGDRERVMLGKLDMGLIVVELAIIGLWFVGLASGGAATRGALSVFFGGPYTAAFWTLVVALGLLAPLTGEWIEHRHGVVPGRTTAILVLIGGLALRWILVYAGQYAGLAEVALR